MREAERKRQEELERIRLEEEKKEAERRREMELNELAGPTEKADGASKEGDTASDQEEENVVLDMTDAQAASIEEGFKNLGLWGDEVTKEQLKMVLKNMHNVKTRDEEEAEEKKRLEEEEAKKKAEEESKAGVSPEKSKDDDEEEKKKKEKEAESAPQSNATSPKKKKE